MVYTADLKSAGCKAIRVRVPFLAPINVLTGRTNCYIIVFAVGPGDGIGIRVGFRSQILRVRVSPGAPINCVNIK